MSRESGPANKNALTAIVGVITTTSALFVAASALFSGLGAPVAALLIGLVVTGVLYQLRYWTKEAAAITWLATAIVLIVIYFVISQPATVRGQVIGDDGAPVGGLALILTNADGIEQRVVTGEDGRFEVYNVPRGRYTITAAATERLLYTGEVPSGWARIFSPTVNTGGLIFADDLAAEPGPTPILPTPTPSALPPDDCIADYGPVCDVYRLANGEEGDFAFEGLAFEYTEDCARSGQYGLHTVFDATQATFGGWGIRWVDAPAGRFDASGFQELVFWVRGFADGARFQIGVKDTHALEVKVESGDWGEVSASEWREFRIPLSAFGEVDLHSIENVNLGFNVNLGSSELCVDDLTFR